jgi:hypothetical protein
MGFIVVTPRSIAAPLKHNIDLRFNAFLSNIAHTPSPHGQMRNDAEELFALAFWEMTIVVEVMLTTVVEVGTPAPSTAFEALADKAANEPEMLLEPIKMWPVSVVVTAANRLA